MMKNEIKFYIDLLGFSVEKKIDFSNKYIMISSSRFLNKSGEFTRNPFIPKSKGWFLDSGGFSFLSEWKKYPFSIDDYAQIINKKKPNFAATMDYPCEPELNIVYKTKNHSNSFSMSVNDRIDMTVKNAVSLVDNYGFNNTIIVPVIQGWNIEEYKYCIDMYHKYDLITDYMAFGSMCRRVSIKEAKQLVTKLTSYLMKFGDVKHHFFGFKISFLKDLAIQSRVYSFDTSAWTFNTNQRGRKEIYAKTQEELEKNYYNYMNKFERILERSKWQMKF